jgi:UDP-glucose 4-epimerase
MAAINEEGAAVSTKSRRPAIGIPFTSEARERLHDEPLSPIPRACTELAWKYRHELETLLAALDDVDGVCHLAARTRVRESCPDPLGYWQTNVGGTLALLHAMSATGTQRLVLASTCGVYGDQTAGQPINESTPVAPISPYGTSQTRRRQRRHGPRQHRRPRRHQPARLQHCRRAPQSPRPGRDPAHSPHDGRPARHRTRAGRKRRSDAIRDFGHVADMAEAFALALDACEPGSARVYNIGSGRPTPVRDVIGMVEQATGRPVARRHVPPAAEPQELLADSKAIQADLGWNPRRSNLRQIVEDAWSAVTSQWSPTVLADADRACDPLSKPTAPRSRSATDSAAQHPTSRSIPDCGI